MWGNLLTILQLTKTNPIMIKKIKNWLFRTEEEGMNRNEELELITSLQTIATSSAKLATDVIRLRHLTGADLIEARRTARSGVQKLIVEIYAAQEIYASYTDDGPTPKVQLPNDLTFSNCLLGLNQYTTKVITDVAKWGIAAVCTSPSSKMDFANLKAIHHRLADALGED